MFLEKSLNANLQTGALLRFLNRTNSRLIELKLATILVAVKSPDLEFLTESQSFNFLESFEFFSSKLASLVIVILL